MRAIPSDLRSIARRSVLQQALLYGLLLLWSDAAAQTGELLYDVDFGPPEHVVGRRVTLGSGPLPRRTPTSSLGSPTVVGSVGTLIDQPALLARPVGVQIDSMTFDLGLGFDRYEVELDAFLASLPDPTSFRTMGFAVLNFTELVGLQRFTFQSDGRIRVGPGEQFVIGDFQIGSEVHIKTISDYRSGLWTIMLNDIVLHEGPVIGGDLSSVAVSIQTAEGATIGVDNIRITGFAGVDVNIDIKPGSDANPINPFSRGTIPVAVLGSDSFDVADVDVMTLAFGPSEAAPVHNAGGHFEDVNDDSFLDLVTHYSTEETGIAFGDPEACLTGGTLGSTPVEGCDAVSTVPEMDGDGLLDAEEAAMGTDPLNPDSDGEEVGAGSSPNDARSMPASAEVTAVPALSTWGLALLAVLLASATTLRVARRLRGRSVRSSRPGWSDRPSDSPWPGTCARPRAWRGR